MLADRRRAAAHQQMSDPFCLALTVVPILSVWWGTQDEDAMDDGKLAQHSNEQEKDGVTTMQKILTHDYEGEFQGWWMCIARQCQPCAPDCFFQLDEDDEVQVYQGDNSSRIAQR